MAADVIQLIRVVEIQTKWDKEGNPQFVENVKMQRAESMENFEIDYDGDGGRRLVAIW